MKQKEFNELYKMYSTVLTDSYNGAKKAIEDGFDFSDINTFGKIAENVINVVQSFDDALSQQEEKEFLIYFGLKIFYEQKLPWYIRLIPKVFIKKKVSKYVNKAVDYLHAKGLLQD